MATRREVNQHRLSLLGSLRDQCRSGQLMPGEPAPPLRQLAEDFHISTRVAHQVLQDLIAEGLFYMVPRVGTFVGRPKVLNSEFYLLLLPDEYGVTTKEDLAQIQHGFEERIAEKGSASLVIPLDKALQARDKGELPTLAGIFDMAYHSENSPRWGKDRSVPRVGFSGRVEDAQYADEVSYDDEGGGRQAARHLIELGHQRIAFLGLHAKGDRAGEMIWSREREQGWCQTLEAAGLNCDALSFRPASPQQNNSLEQMRIGRELGLQILQRLDITAMVAANDFAAMGLIEAAQLSGLPLERWPSVVGFDNRATANGHILTSLRLPAEQVGRAAADLLWERNRGQLSGAPEHRRVAMRLIPRLTSRAERSQMTGAVMSASPVQNGLLLSS